MKVWGWAKKLLRTKPDEVRFSTGTFLGGEFNRGGEIRVYREDGRRLCLQFSEEERLKLIEELTLEGDPP